jgi:glycosyltransferase involved in cell wall biosynthesis
MYGLINSCDAYVSLHRAEGFGLGLAESMFFSKPVIATGYSGNLDFMNNKNSCIVPYKLIKLKKNAYPFWENQFWAEPSIADAGRYMKKLVSNKIFSNKISKLGYLTIKENQSAKKISLIINNRLKDVLKTFKI